MINKNVTNGLLIALVVIGGLALLTVSSMWFMRGGMMGGMGGMGGMMMCPM